MGTVFLVIVLALIVFAFLFDRSKKNKQMKELDSETARIRERFQSRIKALENSEDFTPNKVYEIESFVLMIDDANKDFALISVDNPNLPIYDYKKLIDYEVIENGSQITSGNSKNAVIGGLLFGVTGAIVGASASKETKDICSELKLRIFLDDIENPQFTVEFVVYDTPKNDILYYESCERLNDITALLTYILNKNKEKTEKKIPEIQNIDIAEEIKKFAELRNQGIITSEEFDEKKKQLLNK